MKKYNYTEIKERIDYYIDNEIIPKALGSKLSYTQLFWDDNTTHHMWPEHGFIQQDKEEFRQLCSFILEKDIHSYLEIGIRNGFLVRILDEIFEFEKVAIANLNEIRFPVQPFMETQSFVCKDGIFDKNSEYYIGEFPEKYNIFIGNSQSVEYSQWRKKAGHFDLTFIDADHLYAGVKKDFELNTKDILYKYIAFHDIGKYQSGFIEVKKFWDELQGNKIEFISYKSPPIHMGIGIYWE